MSARCILARSLNETHSSKEVCTTRPLSFPSIFIFLTSWTISFGTNAGPRGHAPSKDFEKHH